MPQIGQISRPWRGVRGHDPAGDGGFGASRSGGLRPHKGVDYVCQEGDACLAPFDGMVKRVGIAYADSSLGSIHIQGTGPHWAYYAKILYVAPDVMEGLVVKRGQRIGTCQNVAKYHGEQDSNCGCE